MEIINILPRIEQLEEWELDLVAPAPTEENRGRSVRTVSRAEFRQETAKVMTAAEHETIIVVDEAGNPLLTISSPHLPETGSL